MSLRLLSTRLFKHGRFIIQNYCKRDIHINILEHGKNRGVPSSFKKGALPNAALRNAGLLRFGQHARRLFVDNILNRVTTTYSSDLRTQATRKFLYGDSAPFFALVGVSLASGTGMLTKDDELEGVCLEIREAVNRHQSLLNNHEITKNISDDFGLDNLNIGPPIAKGCAAVVYSANLKNLPKTETEENIESTLNSALSETPSPEPSRTGTPIPYASPIRDPYRYLHNFGGSFDNLHMETSLSQNMEGTSRQRLNSISVLRPRFDSFTGSEYEEMMSPGVYRQGVTNESTTSSQLTESCDKNLLEYPLALKMMFNYDIQSNAMAILRAMYKETVPAIRKPNPESLNWEKILSEQISSLPAHPNIVLMFGVFCAQVPNLSNSVSLYPMALPTRINPDGYGRNMSLFLLMKRYNYSLREYLRRYTIDMRTSILLYAQLLEAVAHLYRYGIAHRDLKSDNILIEMNIDESPPVLVLSDFGCCLADKSNGLYLPYTSADIDKGGNTALMAPEILMKTPGTFSILNYSKSDYWTCGAIAYEIFSKNNPFYEMTKGDPNALKSHNYKEENLPKLENDVPLVVRKLVENSLQRNPNKRLTPDIAANVIQIFLWAPSSWMKPESNPSSTEILQWLLSLTTKVLCEGGLPKTSGFSMGRRTYTEYLLISSFLARARLNRIKNALDWIHSAVV